MKINELLLSAHPLNSSIQKPPIRDNIKLPGQQKVPTKTRKSLLGQQKLPINPFTAPACNIFGLNKRAHIHACKQYNYLMVLFQIYFEYCAF